MRILRALTQTRIPVSRAELSRRVEMDKAGVWRATARLSDLGIIEDIGMGSHQQVRLRRGHPLSEALVQLFAAESARAERFLTGIKEAAATLRPPPRSVWLGTTETDIDPFGDTVALYVLDTAATIDRSIEALQEKLSGLEKRLQVSFDVRGSTLADLASLSSTQLKELESATLVFGVPPLAVLNGRNEQSKTKRRSRKPTRSHAALDERAHDWASAIAERLRYDPSLVERARISIKRRAAHASAAERKELEEWLRILRTMSRSRLQRFLIEKSERANRLRQTMPFLDVLNADERLEILEAWRARKTHDDV
ncbi:MAG: hypothetical protein ACREOJ_07835 [Gemmatimonadaceae bacterium]